MIYFSLFFLQAMVLIGQFHPSKARLMSPIFVDYVEFFMNGSNVIEVPYDDVKDAFENQVAASSQGLSGFDWTHPYPGSPIDGHKVYLEIAREMHMSPSIVENSTTVLSSLTFDIPDSMRAGSLPLNMDPSWFICQHIFISTSEQARDPVDRGENCGYLSEQCKSDLTDTLTKTWGNEANGTMCAALGFDPIPPSCEDSFGFARQDVLSFDEGVLANTVLGLLHTNKEQQQDSWRMGTGYHAPGNARSYALAANRTYLIATVWGYSQQASAKTVPAVTFACLSSGKSPIQPPAPPPPPSLPPSDVPIPNDVPFIEDFKGLDSIKRWTPYDCEFARGDGYLVGISAPGSSGKAVVHSDFANFIFDAEVTIVGDYGTGNAGLLFRMSNPGSGADSYRGYYAGIDVAGSVVLGRVDNSYTPLASAPSSIEAFHSYQMKIVAIQDIILIFVDNKPNETINFKDEGFSHGMNGVRLFGTSAEFAHIKITPLSTDFSIASQELLLHGITGWEKLKSF